MLSKHQERPEKANCLAPAKAGPGNPQDSRLRRTGRAQRVMTAFQRTLAGTTGGAIATDPATGHGQILHIMHLNDRHHPWLTGINGLHSILYCKL